MDAKLPPTDLQGTIDRIRARSTDLPQALAGLREDMVTPAGFAADIPRIESWLDTQAIAAEGMDRKAAAAYMVGGMAWSVCIWMAAFALTGERPIRRVAIGQERYWYGSPETGHEYVRYPISVEVGDGPPNHRETIERMFEPIVAATMLASGLSAGALWRLVADNVASGFLWAGKPLGQVERAIAMANEIIAEGRLHNGKTGFLQVTAGDARDWFLVRGGCCRYYTTSGATRDDYCTSCVMRKREDQIARYTNYLASQQVAAE
ncbi:MAG TPA: hypothetical protein VFE52_01050 [Devosia sp.]|nr:hypothetical protein [Devosia sp.]